MKKTMLRLLIDILIMQIKIPKYIEDNLTNPVIIDFYYNYYLYLVKKDLKTQAEDILKKLYNKTKRS